MTTELMREWDGPSDAKAVAYLRERGFLLLPGALWSKPYDLKVANKDLRAMLFLHEQWDYRAALYEEEEKIPPIKRRH